MKHGLFLGQTLSNVEPVGSSHHRRTVTSSLLPDFPLSLTVLFHPLFSKVCSRHREREAVMEVGQAKTRVGEQSAIPV